MAKKEKEPKVKKNKKSEEEIQKAEYRSEEVQKIMDKYTKAAESEEAGKRTALSLIGGVILIFILLFIVLLKLNGVGKVVVFDKIENNGTTSYSMHTTDAKDVQATNLAEAIIDKVADNDKTTTTTSASENN